MKIAYVLTSLAVGGAERQALQIAERMAQRGHGVALLVLSARLPPETEWPTNLDVTCLEMDRSPMRMPVGLAKASRFLRAFGPDLLHGQSFHANLLVRWLRLTSPSLRVACTFHNIHEGGRRRMLGYRLTDGLSSLNTAVSEAVRERFVTLNAVPQRKCIVVPNGIDTTEFAPSQLRRLVTRQKMGAEESFIWLAAGRIAPSKDYSTLLRAFAQVRAAHGNARLWIAGPEASADEAASVHKVERELHLNESVVWLGLRRDLPALMDGADAFVAGGIWEGMPLAVGEAMAMEKSVVATDAGGTREMLGDAGWIVPTRDAPALAGAMIEVMRTEPQDRIERGRLARDRVSAGFSIDAKAEQWEKIYSGLLEAR